jgi:hypothetical protein
MTEVGSFRFVHGPGRHRDRDLNFVNLFTQLLRQPQPTAGLRSTSSPKYRPHQPGLSFRLDH